MAITNEKDYILEEFERIKREQWCLGERKHGFVSSQEAYEHFTHDIYPPYNLTPEDYFHLDAIRDITQQIADGKRSLDDPLLIKLLKGARGTLDKVWNNLEKSAIAA